MKLLYGFFLLFITSFSQAQIITTFAGTGTKGYSGNGGPATAAQMGNPWSTCSDKAGNIYIADMENHVVSKVNAAGIITNFAGTGVSGFSGDGGPASSAQLKYPCGICCDNAGNIYITDRQADIIRKVDANGIISTIAGVYSMFNMGAGFSGDGGPAINAQIATPQGICVDDSGNIFFVDLGNLLIRKIDNKGIITTTAGQRLSFGYSGDGGPATNAKFMAPWFIDIDKSGNLYVTDYLANAVRKIDPSGIITTFCGGNGAGYSGDGGAATSAKIKAPFGVAVDGNGNVYIAEASNAVIRKVNSAGIISTFAGNGIVGYTGDGGPPTSAEINTPYGICVDNSANFYLVDHVANVVRKIGLCTLAAISSQPANKSTCDGGNATFTISSTNVATYQWQLNSGSGWKDISDDSVYSGSANNQLNITGAKLSMNNYQYRCVAKNSCSNLASSAAVLNVANLQQQASITIATLTDTICAGSVVTFTTTAVNAGTAPSYQWEKNGVVVGNLSSYTDSTLINGDTIICELTSNAPCVNAVAISNKIIMTVTSVQSQSVTIAAAKDSICPGGSTTFFATVTNGGTSLVYQWFKNNLPVGNNNSTYTDNAISGADTFSCTITFNNKCNAVSSAKSNKISITVLSNPVVYLDKTNTLCKASTKLLDAGNYTSYLWNDGSTGRTLLVDKPGTYFVSVTDNNGCKGSDTSSITGYLPQPAGFLPPDTSICSASGSIVINAKTGFANYLWSNNSTSAFLDINKPGLYWLEVTDNNNCKGRDSIAISSKDCLNGFYIPTAFSPNNDGRNDLFKPMIFGSVTNYSFVVYNRLGQKVFESNNPGKGWDGTLKGQSTDNEIFVWICSYKLNGEPQVVKRGSVILIR